MLICQVKNIRPIITNASLLSLLLAGCVNTEGVLEIEGKVTDAYTKKEIPGRSIIIQGLMKNNENVMVIDAGQFETDSSGKFRYTLKKIKDAGYYNFNFVGDSNYAFKTRKMGLYELEQNSRFLSFSLDKLASLSIRIFRKSRNPVFDTLSLSWVSDGIFFWSLFPYKIYNYNRTYSYFASTPGTELRWYGGYVNTIVKTRVFAEKKTKVYWDLYRNGKRMELIDTITCRRDFDNNIYFTY